MGGIGGGFDSPANGLYDKLSSRLEREKIRFIDVGFSQASDLLQSVNDLRTAIAYAKSQGARKIILLGHSFGGGVVISTAVRDQAIGSVIAMSGQTYGAERAAELSPRRLLLIHGFFDFVVPRCAAERVYRAANHPKNLQLVPATHLLNEAPEQVFGLALEEILSHKSIDKIEKGG